MMSKAPCWQAVALTREVKRKPVRVLVKGMPIVVFRDATGQVAALQDRCPHRLVALSGGAVRAGEIECPYHGWRFDGRGHCTAIPGLVGDVPNYRVKRFDTTERQGAIFLSDQPTDTSPYIHSFTEDDVVTRVVRSSTRSTLLDVAENILDATHTHFTHRGLLRGLNSKRCRVQVEVHGGTDWVEAVYTGEDRQQGVISKLLEGARVRTVGRFRAPGIAELEFWGPRGLALATVFHLRQADADTVEGVGWLIGPRQGGLGHAKALLFKPLFRIALEQDRRVLASAKSNAALMPGASALGPLDFLRADIEAIIAGQDPRAATEPRVYEMEL